MFNPNYCQGVVEGTFIDSTPVEEVKIGDKVSAGMGKGMISMRQVTDVSSKFVENQPAVTITTKSGKTLTATREHTHFAGYINQENEEEVFYTYLMYKESHGYRIGVTRKYRYSPKNTLGFKTRTSQENADALWLLKVCNTEQEAHFWEDYFSAQYGLPTVTFNHVQGTLQTSGLILSQELIDKLYQLIDTPTRAKQLLLDMGIAHEYPHHTPKCVTKSRRRNVTITICADPRGINVLHDIEMSGNDWADAEILKAADIRITDNGKGTGWRYRKYSQQLGDLYQELEKVKALMSVNVIQTASFSAGRALPLMPAGNVLSGMVVFSVENGQIVLDRVLSATHHLYTGTVYDLNIEKVHNYSANGILTHNSIYSCASNNATQSPKQKNQKPTVALAELEVAQP